MRTDDIYRLLSSLRLFAPDAAQQTSPVLENLLSESSTLSLVDHGLLGPTGARSALFQAQSYDTLAFLDLSHNSLGDQGASVLWEGLSGRRAQLYTVKLASCGISDVGLLAIIQHALLPGPPRLPNLRQLFLNNNKIQLGPVAAALLASALSHPASQLQRLNLTSNRICGLRHFIRNLQARSLRILQLNACGLEDHDGQALFDWLLDPSNPLIRLELNANRLTADIMSIFTTRLLETGLQHLELLANMEPAPLWEPVRFGPYEMAAQDANRFFAHQLRQEALGLLAIARIVSQARPATPSTPTDSFPILQLPVELRQRIVLCTRSTQRTPFHIAASSQRTLGIFLSQAQFARLWSFASDRGTLIKSSRDQRAKWRTEDQRENFIEDEKENFLIDISCLKPEERVRSCVGEPLRR